jgi:hypothetical protein
VTKMQISTERLGVRDTAEGSAAEHPASRAMDDQHGAVTSARHSRTFCRQSRVRAAQR